MDSPRPIVGDDEPFAPAAAARCGWGGIGGGVVVAALLYLLIRALQKLIELDYSSDLPLQAVLVACGCCLAVGALQKLAVVVEDRRQLQAAAASFPAWAWGRLGGLSVALRRLVEFQFDDYRLQAAVFLLACGSCTVLNGTVVNPSANWEHVLVGFLLVVVGAAIAVLTLAGAGAGTAAAQMEGFLRRFF